MSLMVIKFIDLGIKKSELLISNHVIKEEIFMAWDIYNSTATLKLNRFFNLTEKFRKNGMLDNEDNIKINNCSFINDLIGHFSKNRDILDPQDPNFEKEMEKIANYFISHLNTLNKFKSSKAFVDNESENDNDNYSDSDCDSDSETDNLKQDNETKDILKYLFTSIENINDKFKGIEELISTILTSKSNNSNIIEYESLYKYIEKMTMKQLKSFLQ
ncbi:hypothetical protein ACTFIW_010444 [Dictyostelium discoideum]